MTLTTRVILASAGVIILGGTGLMALCEPALEALPVGQRWQAAFFQVMTASTTVGSNTMPIGSLAPSSVVLLTIAMLIGASPAGTGGDLKTTTVTALWSEMIAVVRARPEATFWGRAIPAARLRAALATTALYLVVLAVGLFALTLVESTPLVDQTFECASALGTVGLSRGITGSLSSTGKLIIVSLMFLGRVGPIVVGLALFHVAQPQPEPAQSEDLIV